MDRFDRVFILNNKLLWYAGLGDNQTNRERFIRFGVMGLMSFYAIVAQVMVLIWTINISNEVSLYLLRLEPYWSNQDNSIIGKKAIMILFCHVLTLERDLVTATPILQMFITSTCLIVSHYTGILNQLTIRKIFTNARQDWQALENDVELHIMQRHAHIAKLFTLIVTSMSYLYLLTSLSPPLLRIILSTNEVRKDIDRYPIISCFDYFLDRRSYCYPIVIYQIITCAVLIMVAIANYSSYFLIFQHVCARLDIIKYEINRPFLNKDDNDDVLETPLDHSKWVIDIVRRLARTTEFMALLNTAFERSYLVQMSLAFGVVILDFLCLFQIPVLLTQKERMGDVLTLLFFVVGTVLPIYHNCYVGQTLIDYCMAVYEEACLVPIHNLSLKTQKLLLTTLMISSKPLEISIGKFYVSSHEFFSNLIRSALSFAMVLRSLQKI